jgi:acid phosphatase
MRGTIGFERLNCGSKGLFMRIKLNDAVYEVPKCKGGPGKSCELSKYQGLVAKKSAAFGDFEKACNITNSVVPVGQDKTTFLTNLGLPFEYMVKP